MDNQRIPNRDINAAQRAVHALALRAQKLTYEEIASRTGYSSASACRKAVMREMDRCVVKNVEALRSEELFILDSLHAAVWRSAFPETTEKPDDDTDEEEAVSKKKKVKLNLFAIDRLLAISEARRRLMGLDIPADIAANANVVVVREVPTGWITAPVVETMS